MSDDPFGRPARPEEAFGDGPPPGRRRGRIRVVAGVLLVIVGIAGVVGGIVRAVGDSARIEDDAVGRGVLREGASPDAVVFTVPDGGSQDYTVYLRLGGLGVEADDQSLVAGDVSCDVRLPNEGRTGFSGSRQGVSVALGSSVSVGHFSSGPGRVRVRCAFDRGDSRAGVIRAGDVPFVVTAGRPSGAIGGVIAIIGGAFVLAFGIGIAIWGFVATRRGRS